MPSSPIRMAGAALAALVLFASAAVADIVVEDAYARSVSPTGASGAAFMVIRNTGDEAERLLEVTSGAAKRVGLHATSEDATGVVRMRPIEGGVPVPAGGAHALARGGDHVMFMGLDAPWQDGDTIPLTLTFEKAGEVALVIEVDNARRP